MACRRNRQGQLSRWAFEAQLTCYKIPRMKTSVRWFLFEYQGLELVILSKGFKTKKLAEKARLKYPERDRRKIGIGVVREPSQH
jgi:hypothetical protein